MVAAEEDKAEEGSDEGEVLEDAQADAESAAAA